MGGETVYVEEREKRARENNPLIGERRGGGRGGRKAVGGEGGKARKAASVVRACHCSLGGLRQPC